MVSGGGRAATAGALVCLALTIGVVSFGRLQPGQAASAAPGAEALAAQPWSPRKLAALRAAGKPVLVNFTAAWCVTCQVNERLVLSRPEVGAALRHAGAVYLIADWTNRDPAIAKALAEQGRIGVPLYLYYGPGSASPKVLPQILTPSIVVSTLSGAA
jgi:thiol:disulfide interchange protein DsbD